jgi:hypothetical protein
MSPSNAVRAVPAKTGNGSQNNDQHRQAIKEIDATAATAAQGSRAVVATWRRNARETIQVALDRYQGREVVELRTWLTAEDGSLRPTRTGITLAIRHLPQLAEALAAALTVARERGLLTDRDGGAS